MKKEKKNIIDLTNKKAYFKYEILENFCAGIVLIGAEVKSIRNSDISFTDSYCLFMGDELFLRNFHIAEYKNVSYNNHEPKRDRKLLLTKKELTKLKVKIKIGGLTIVPLKIFFNEKGLVKFNIGLAKGKKDFEKRNTILDRDMKRQEGRNVKL